MQTHLVIPKALQSRPQASPTIDRPRCRVCACILRTGNHTGYCATHHGHALDTLGRVWLHEDLPGLQADQWKRKRV